MAAALVATNGTVDVERVLLMRVDYLIWIMAGRAALNRRAEGQSSSSAAAGQGGARRINSIEELKSFLGGRPA